MTLRTEKMQLILRDLAMKVSRRDADLKRALKDYPPPWINLTDRWNAAQDHYYLRNGKHWHGSLRGCKKRSSKHCEVLIVLDCYQGERLRIDPETWNGDPDYYDFRKIVAVPHDELFRGRSSVVQVEAIGFEGVADLVVEAVNRAWGASA